MLACSGTSRCLLFLPGADVDHAVSQVDVVAVERERFPRAHAGDGQQPDQRLDDAPRVAAVASPRAAAINAAISLLGVDVGGDPRPVPGQQVRWTGPRWRGRSSPGDAANPRATVSR